MIEKLNPITVHRIFGRLTNLEMKDQVRVLGLISVALDAAELGEKDPREIDPEVATARRLHDLYEWVEDDGYLCFVKLDPYPDNPRRDFDVLTELICFTRHGEVGDLHGIELKETRSWREIEKQVREARPDTAYLYPLFMLDHGDRKLATTDFGDPWDSRQIGFVVVPNTSIPPEWKDEPDLDEKVEALVDAELKDYNHYLVGEVWNVEIYAPDGEEIHRIGYLFGTQDDARKYAMEILEQHREDSNAEPRSAG